MFNLTNVELNMCVSIIFGFISEIMVLIVTSAFKVLYRMSGKGFGTCAIHILHGRESLCDDSCAT